jgi:hypothetical protein
LLDTDGDLAGIAAGVSEAKVGIGVGANLRNADDRGRGVVVYRSKLTGPDDSTGEADN